jgi:hypothetical protein
VATLAAVALVAAPTLAAPRADAAAFERRTARDFVPYGDIKGNGGDVLVCFRNVLDRDDVRRQLQANETDPRPVNPFLSDATMAKVTTVQMLDVWEYTLPNGFPPRVHELVYAWAWDNVDARDSSRVRPVVGLMISRDELATLSPYQLQRRIEISEDDVALTIAGQPVWGRIKNVQANGQPAHVDTASMLTIDGLAFASPALDFDADGAPRRARPACSRRRTACTRPRTSSISRRRRSRRRAPTTSCSTRSIGTSAATSRGSSTRTTGRTASTSSSTRARPATVATRASRTSRR